ncbi:MAG: hypothetical protein M3430_19740 [Acidobacteriota bacterium]|nr:hypothetical protein [Acidobacteriota bacterium]
MSPIWKFPQTDGDELIKCLREMPPPAKHSGGSFDGLPSAGFDTHIPKPVDPATLTERIEQLKRLKPARACEP